MMMFGRIMTFGCRAERGRKSGQDLVWFGLMLVPVNNFSVMLGRRRRFLCITSILGCTYVVLKDTTRRPEWGSNPRLLEDNVAKHSKMCWIPLSASHDFGCRSGRCRFH